MKITVHMEFDSMEEAESVLARVASKVTLAPKLDSFSSQDPDKTSRAKAAQLDQARERVAGGEAPRPAEIAEGLRNGTARLVSVPPGEAAGVLKGSREGAAGAAREGAPTSPSGGAADSGGPPSAASKSAAGAPPPPVEKPPAEREPGADDAEVDDGDAVFYRCQTVKSVVKVLVERGVTKRANVLEKCLDLMGQGVPVFGAIPEDQLPDRVAASLVALGVPEEV